MTRLEQIRRFNLISSILDTVGAGTTTWFSVKLITWGTAAAKNIDRIAGSTAAIEDKDQKLKIALGIAKTGGMLASGLLSVVLIIVGILVAVLAINLIIPAVFGFVSVRRASRCEEPAKSVKIVRTADIVRLVFHTFLMIGSVILIIIAIYNSIFGFPIIVAALISTIPAVLSVMSLIWQRRLKCEPFAEEIKPV